MSLLLKDPNILLNAQNENGNTASHLALEQGDEKMFAELLRAHRYKFDFDINLQNNDGNTLLHLAANKGLRSSVQKLFNEPNLDPNIKNAVGQMPRDLAIGALTVQLFNFLHPPTT